MIRTPVTFALAASLLSTLSGCATHNEFASEADLHYHNQQARDYCKQLNDGAEYYQCFDRYILKASSVTVHKLNATQRSLQRAIETHSS